jgi:outer membrane protein assembly factor BamB
MGRLGLLVSAMAILLALAAASAPAAPITGMADAMRTGWFPDEPGLSAQVLERGDFGEKFDTEIEGQVYAQPLVVGNTVFVATEENWIYGIDKKTGAIQWERNLGVPWNPMDLGCEDLLPSIGITGTPVIDPETGVAYFTSKSYVSGTSGPAVWRMHAVDVTDGNEELGFPVEISGEAENFAGVAFNPAQELQRPALLMMNGVVYAGFGSHCDQLPYQGWIAGVSTSGQLKTMWAGWKKGSGVWQGGGGLASDGEGQILFATGNSFEPAPLSPTPTPPEDLGDSVVRLNVAASGEAGATDFFAPWNREELDNNDRDLGSGGVIALPSQYFGTEAVPNLLLETGKERTVYLLNRDQLGGFAQGPEEKDDVVQEVQITKGSFGSPAIWPGDGGYIYIPSSGTVAVLRYSEVLGQPHLEYVAEPAEHGNFGSGSPIVTSDGTTSGSGIVWIVNRCNATPGCHSTLRAYPAAPSSFTPQPLWSGDVGVADKFAHLVSDEGNIYVGTDGHLLAFGALRHTLTVAPPGSGGTVKSDVAGIECGSTCSHSYDNGTAVTLTASPSAGFEFSGWSGAGCSGTGTCTVTMDRDASVAAAFTAIPPPPPASGGGGTSSGGTSGSGSGSGESGSNPAPAKPSATKIVFAKISSKTHSAEFRFKATGATGFQCRLVKVQKRKPAFSRCSSPKKYKNLKPGSYVFEVRATNAVGADPKPAKKSFRI